jgi:hypothetical protein
MWSRVLSSSIIVVTAVLAGLIEVAVADPRAGGIGKVEVKNASTAVSSAVSEAVMSELKSASQYDASSSTVMTVSLDGYFVRVGNTPAQLRQQGGRDVARGVVSLSGAGGYSEQRQFVIRLRGDGFENISQERRAKNLQKSIAESAVKSIR